jgi:hypothetical protein
MALPTTIPISPNGMATGIAAPVAGASASESARAADEDQLRAVVRERDQLRMELAKTKAQRDRYLKAVYESLQPDLYVDPIDKEEMLRNFGKHPTLQDVIDELTNSPE